MRQAVDDGVGKYPDEDHGNLDELEQLRRIQLVNIVSNCNVTGARY